MNRQTIDPPRRILTALAMLTLCGGAALAATQAPKHGTHPPAPSVDTWRVVAASGTVEFRSSASGAQPSSFGVSDDPWTSVQRGDDVPASMRLRTGRRGRATLARDGSVLIVDPGSDLELPGRGYGQIETSIRQNAGSVLYEVDRRGTPHFEVVTPFLVAGVKGTAFLVTVNDRYAAVTVETGLVEVIDAHDGRSTDVGAGETLLRELDRIELEHFPPQARLPRDARRELRRMVRMDRRDDDREKREKDDRGRPEWVDASDSSYGVTGKGQGAAAVGNGAAHDDLIDDATGSAKGGVHVIRNPGADPIDPGRGGPGGAGPGGVDDPDIDDPDDPQDINIRNTDPRTNRPGGRS